SNRHFCPGVRDRGVGVGGRRDETEVDRSHGNEAGRAFRSLSPIPYPLTPHLIHTTRSPVAITARSASNHAVTAEPRAGMAKRPSRLPVSGSTSNPGTARATPAAYSVAAKPGSRHTNGSRSNERASRSSTMPGASAGIASAGYAITHD